MSQENGGPPAWQREGPPTRRPTGTSDRQRRRPVRPIASVISQLPLWTTSAPERHRQVAGAVHHARVTAESNRAAVTAHPDLAEQLVTRLGYQRPDQWHGYVPPRTISGAKGELPNTSPRRAALVDLVAEAKRRGAP
jgi:hypothetical protein